MLLAGMLYLPLPQGQTDPATGQIRIVLPGDPSYRGHATSPSYSYKEQVTRKLAAFDDPRKPPVNLAFPREANEFYTKFLDAPNSHEAK